LITPAAEEHEVADDERLRWGDEFRRETGCGDAALPRR